MDPRERISFVEKVLPRIDDVSPCLWAASLSHVQLPKWALLAFGLACAWPRNLCLG